jgi:hypothetical protein
MATYTYKQLGSACTKFTPNSGWVELLSVPTGSQYVIKSVVAMTSTASGAVASLYHTTGSDLKGTIHHFNWSATNTGRFEDSGNSAVTIGPGYTNTSVVEGCVVLTSGTTYLSLIFSIANGGAGTTDVALLGAGSGHFPGADCNITGIYKGGVAAGNVSLTQFQATPVLTDWAMGPGEKLFVDCGYGAYFLAVGTEIIP